MGKDKKKKKDHKKQKKQKKAKKSKRSSSSASSSDERDASKYKWTEADKRPAGDSRGGVGVRQQTETEAEAEASAGRGDWLSGLSSELLQAGVHLGAATSSKIRAAEKERAAKEASDAAATTVAGLQKQQQQQQQQQLAPPKTSSSSSGSGSRDWYRLAYRRCQQQARDEGRELEAVAAERWGSLRRLRQLAGVGQGGGSSKEAEEPPAKRPKEREKATAAVPPPPPPAKEQLVTVEEERHVTQDDINQLSAQVLRSQLDGDGAKAAKLQKRLDVMLEAQRRKLKVKIRRKVAKAQEAPAASATASASASASAATAAARSRDDEDASTIEELRARERVLKSSDMLLDFAEAAGRSQLADNDEYEALRPGEAAGGRGKQKQQLLDKSSDRQLALQQRQQHKQQRCPRCLGNIPSSLLVHTSSSVCLQLPAVRSLTRRHCQLTTVEHVASISQLEDEAFNQLLALKRRLTQLLAADGQDCVFLELAAGHGWQRRHLLLEAVPLPADAGHLAPMYFRKALLEAGPEWATNKKLVPLRDMDVRRTVPKGFPYFCVEFGCDSGLVHVVEDSADFPEHFGREVVAGILDLPPELWRRPKPDDWEQLLDKVSEFRFFWGGGPEPVIDNRSPDAMQ